MGLPPPYRDQNPTMTSITVTAKKVSDSRRFGESVKGSMEFTLYRDQESWLERGVTDLILSLDAYVFTQRLAEEIFNIPYNDAVTHEHWATWWDQFKAEEIAPLRLWGWVARRWPPKTVTVETRVRGKKVLRLEREAMFPEANYAIPPENWFGRPVFVETHQILSSDDLPNIETKVR